MAVDPELRKKFDAIVNRAMGSSPKKLSDQDIKDKRFLLQMRNKYTKNSRITRDVEYVHGVFDEIIAEMSPIG